MERGSEGESRRREGKQKKHLPWIRGGSAAEQRGCEREKCMYVERERRGA